MSDGASARADGANRTERMASKPNESSGGGGGRGIAHREWRCVLQAAGGPRARIAACARATGVCAAHRSALPHRRSGSTASTAATVGVGRCRPSAISWQSSQSRWSCLGAGVCSAGSGACLASVLGHAASACGWAVSPPAWCRPPQHPAWWAAPALSDWSFESACGTIACNAGSSHAATSAKTASAHVRGRCRCEGAGSDARRGRIMVGAGGVRAVESEKDWHRTPTGSRA